MKTLKDFWSQLWLSQKQLLVLRFFCATIWAIELFWAQDSAFAVVPWIRYPVLVQCFRFYLDLVFALSMVFLVRRRFLTLVLGASLVMLMVVGTYGSFFHRPMMPVRVWSQWREGWSLRHSVYGLISMKTILVVAFGFVLQFWLLARSGRIDLPWPLRWRLLAVAFLAYFLPQALVQTTNMRLAIGQNGSLGRNVFVYGYTLPWIGDVVANRDLGDQAERAKAYLSHHYDRITPLEPLLRIPGNIVVLQLESVGGSAIEAGFQEKWIMPFLRELKGHSMFFRIRSFHRNGSCDMDYAATTHVEPYPGVVPYRLPGMSYTNATPAFMKQHGFETYVFHGNSALFYERGAVFDDLGFDHMFFKEELAPLHLPTSLIGVRDADVLRCMLKAIQPGKRSYLFGITLDSHTPFQQLLPSEMEIFPHPENTAQRYLNAIRHVDNCLRTFIGQLPKGTTVVLYGDHTAGIHSDEFNSDDAQGRERVGCLIYQVGGDLGAQQKTRNAPIATDGSLNLLDVMSYLRQSVAANAGSAPLSPTGKPR